MKNLILISSLEANANKKNYYFKLKGELENEIIKVYLNQMNLKKVNNV